MTLPAHIQFVAPGRLRLLDQRLLPREVAYVECRDWQSVAAAIRDMVVRGAPAIGIAASYAMALAPPLGEETPGSAIKKELKSAGQGLKASRPTAVNLPWAVDRLYRLASDLLADGADGESLRAALLDEAVRVHEEDIRSCKAIGKAGSALLGPGSRLLTHCNAGALATGGFGTALGVIRAAAEQGKVSKVFVDETRPYLQGARLTAWELMEDGIPCSIVCDSMAGSLLARGEVDAVVVGADRIARNGDTANKVGTYPLAVLAARHSVPFYVAAPLSTFDPALADGSLIPIEERGSGEMLGWGGVSWAPEGAVALHIAFDVTPAGLVTAIVTEEGVLSPVNTDTVSALLGKVRV